MTLGGCTILAVEGTHAAGKTTLVHALAAHYGAVGVQVATVEEPARSRPFIDDIVMRGKGDFDLVTQVDLFAAQLVGQIRHARGRRLLIADKTIANVLAYARIFVDHQSGGHDEAVLAAMQQFCQAWAGVYDAVFLCQDHFDATVPGDPYRSRVQRLQRVAHSSVQAAIVDTGHRVFNIPAGFDLTSRVAWVVSQVDQAGLLSG